METAGGGWSLATNIVANDGHGAGYHNTAFWTGNSDYGNLGTHFFQDYKSGVVGHGRSNHFMRECITFTFTFTLFKVSSL